MTNVKVIAAHPYVWGDHPSFDRETATVTDENGRYRVYLFPEAWTGHRCLVTGNDPNARRSIPPMHGRRVAVRC